MNFLVSPNALHSFPNEIGYKSVVLIEASPAKIRQHYSNTDDGKVFYSGDGGVEKLSKLVNAARWISENNVVWAPVIDLRSADPTRFFFADGRHTCVALEHAGYDCIRVAVPNDRESKLRSVIGCGDHT